MSNQFVRLRHRALSQQPDAVLPERKPRRLRRFVRRLFLLSLLSFIGGNLWIAIRAQGRIFTKVAGVPANEVGLVLGTSSRLRGGSENPFFAGRIAAAAELYRAGKVRHLLLSGDNSEADYDEPTNMRVALAEQGVPERATTLDYGGLRTLDSMVRAKEVFGVTRMTIITDDFHAARAILLARHFGIDACAFTSAPVALQWSKKTRMREIAARIAALLDLYVLHTQRHFLGPKVGLPGG